MADYVELQNYTKVAKIHGVSDMSVRRIVEEDDELLTKIEEKKVAVEHTILDKMEQQHNNIYNVYKLGIARIYEIIPKTTDPQRIATALGILIDKQTKLMDYRLKEREIMLKERESASNFDYELKYTGIPITSIGKSFYDINRDIDSNKYTYYDFRGGRGSLKSSYCGIKLVDRIMKDETICALAVRQIKDTLKDSCFAQIIWAIDELGLTEEFHITKSPMEIRRRKTGQTIYFRGGDEPLKIKSIRPPKDQYIGVIWLEEKDQLRGTEAIRSIYQSAMRGGENTIVFSSYNTPRSQQHFVNVEAHEDNPKRVIHHSYYYDAPPEWLGQPFIDLANQTKASNERTFRHEYLGEATGTGGTIFENLTDRTITDDEIKSFDTIRQGIDFGFAVDAAAWGEMHFDRKHRKLYIFNEIYETKLTDERFANKIKKKRVNSSIITADSAEPKSIAMMNSLGLRVYGAKKGPDSRDYGYKFLQSLNGIIIDKKRCPNAYREFVNSEYAVDKYGNYISEYPDKDNHYVDCVRYAVEKDMLEQRIGISNKILIR